jgi:hypothetical protein
MPINTDLNIAPYFDDFDLEKQFYKILFKPAYAVQARELTQLQTILQNQIEQFGDNVYKEGTIIKGCNFTNLDSLQFVKLVDKTGFDVLSYISGPSTDILSGVETNIDVVYELEGVQSGLKAEIISASRGFETRPPDLNTFFVNYLTTNQTSNFKTFLPGENLRINRYKYNGSNLYSTETNIENINVTLQSNSTGKSFGIQASPGVIFQKGHFLFADDQTLVVSKYNNVPDGVSIGYSVSESLISSLQDDSLYDNANGSTNENAPGADRLKMVPVLIVKSTAQADVDKDFFTLARYENGSAVVLRDVSQFNSIAEELARRTYEESGDYILEDFIVNTDRRGTDLKALVGSGTAYVRGFRVENRGIMSFTIPQISNTEIVQNQAVSFDYGSYVDITDISGTVDVTYGTANLLNGSSTKIGEAIIGNITPDKIYLFGVKMTASNTTFGEVNFIQSTGGLIGIANNSVIKDVSKAPVIFSTGLKSLKETSDMTIPVRAIESVNVSNNTIVLNAGVNEDFGAVNDDMVFVDATNTYIPITSYATSLGNSVLTINLDPAGGSSPAGELYYNKRLQVATPYNKVAVAPHIKVNYTSTQTKYSLGFPDVYAIEDIYDAFGTRYTDSFRLKTNQKDHYYDISYMEYIPGSPKPANGVLTIKLNVFQINSSTGSYFFTINSYPINDVTDPLPAGKVRSNQIPVYTGTNRKIYNLRECFDFRPYADKDALADYTANAGSAPTITAPADGAAPTFSGTDYIIPALNQSATTDIEHYLSRIDLITVDSYGRFSLIEGTENSNPAPPKIGADQLIISEVTIPGYPALSAKEANDQQKPEYAVKARARGVKNYTMRDIAKIERKIESLEYYISLNQLEQQVENLLIQDENGLTRFKNGYIVDPFNDINLGNLEDTDFSAAVHFDRKILTPSVKTFPLDLRYKSSSGASIFPSTSNPDVGALSRDSHVKLLGQNYATSFRNCVSNFYSYAGEGTLVPEHDMVHDTVTNPVNLEIDLATPFNQFVRNLQQFIPMTGSVTRNIGTVQIGAAADWFPSTVQQTTTSNIQINEPTTRTQQVGDFVSNVEFRPFMRSRDVRVYMSGLRPNTRHYFFFDEVPVNDRVAPGTNVNSARAVQPFGNQGDAVLSDSNGVIRAIFTIPEETFFVGERVLTVTDVDQYSSIASAGTSGGRLTYHAYNIAVDKSALTATTRVPQSSIVTSTTTRTLPGRPRPRPQREEGGGNNDGGGGCGGCDPLAQTFFIKDGMGRGSNTVFASKIDLYFKRKSDVNGVNIMLREVLNGYPTALIIPFSKIHLTPDQVNVSDDASVVTTVTFDAPIRLDTEKEYCVVVHPDANDPNYLIFTSKIGGNDLTPGVTQGQPVVQDWGDGVLFTSTNNRAWSAYQDEDIKFTLYRHDFNSSSGTVTLTNADHEFITLSDWTGRFLPGEKVYQTIGSTATVSIALNTSLVTASGIDVSTIYSIGDFIQIAVPGGSRYDIFRIISIDSSTEMTLDRPISFAVANGTGIPVVVGEVIYYNKVEPDTIYLKDSSATSSKRFTTSSTITGVRSGTTGTIGSIDDINLSYVQPLIMKSNDSVTSTTIDGTFVDPSNTISTYNTPLKFGDNNYFSSKGVLLYSKSNDPTRAKAFDFNIRLANRNNSTSTPIVDLETAELIAYQFKSTNSADTTSKYISKTIELAADLDAEDMEVILTGYRPLGTDIKVYIKPQNSFDSANFESNDWVELELYSGTGVYSSSINLNDYKEFKYRVKASDKDVNGIITYTNSTTGTFSSYRKFAIRIDLLSENIHVVPTVKDYRGIALT